MAPDAWLGSAASAARVAGSARCLTVVVALLLLAGCASSTPPRPVTSGTASAPHEVAALVAQAEQRWAQRDDPRQLAEVLALYERALAGAPRRDDLLVRLAEGEFHLAHELDDEAERLAHWRRGHAWGEAALRCHPAYAAAVDQQGRDATEALELLGPDAVPALYWTCLNLTAWSTGTGMLAAATNMGRFRALMRRAEQLDPRFDDGGVERFFAVDLASAPALAGGDREAAEERFGAAIAVDPGRFVNRTLYVQHLLLPEGRLAEARVQLERVLAGDADADPARAPEQRSAQRRARQLLESLESLEAADD